MRQNLFSSSTFHCVLKDNSRVYFVVSDGFRANGPTGTLASEGNESPLIYVLGCSDEDSKIKEAQATEPRTSGSLSPLSLSSKRHSDTSFEIRRGRAFTFMADVMHSSYHSADSVYTVGESVIKIFPHLCPAQLAVSMLRFVRRSFNHTDPFDLSLRSLGINKLEQTQVRIFHTRFQGDNCCCRSLAGQQFSFLCGNF